MTVEPPRQSAGPDPTAVVLAVLAVFAGSSAVVGELLLRSAVALIPAPIAVIDASLAWLFLTLAVLRAGTARARHEVPQIRSGIRRVVLGTLVLYPSLALVGPLEQWVSIDAAFAVDAVSTALALPLLVAGIIGLCWPPGFSKTQARVLVADALVGVLGLAVLWVIAVIPLARQSAERTGAPTAWATADAVFMLALALLLVLLATAARRRALIPARQIALLHAFIGLHLIAGLLEVLVPQQSVVTAIRVFHLGAVAGGTLLLLFLLAPSGQTETLRESRARELYGAIMPLLPIPVASIALVGVLAAETTGPRTAQTLGGLLLVFLLLSIVVLRALASAELRGAAREKADVQLRRSTEEEWFQVLVGRTSDLTLVLRRDGRIVYSTPSVHRATGMGPEELRGRPFTTLLTRGPDRDEAVGSLMGRADLLAGEPTEPVDLLLRGATGTGREVEWQFTALVGLDLDGYLVHGRDVTDDRRMRSLLAESATRDPLTGLHNRNGFLGLATGRRGRRCVLVVNLRRFADYNDRYGHAGGDHVLRQVAQILRDLPGPVAEPARLSADTFSLLVTGSVPDIEVVSAVASLREALRMATLPDGRPLPLDIAAGYAVGEGDVATSDLLSRAELATMRSRSLDRSPLVRYEPTLRVERDAAAAAEADLRSALRERALVVRYQPIVRLTDGAVVGAEALVRRRRADGSLESPDVFIPLAEQLGLVDEVDYAVLMRALTEMRQVAEATGRRLPVSVNVSASELDDGLEHRVLDALAATDWHAEHLIIEVTETALSTRTDEASRLLRRLQRHGCSVAMDDFGTGYSSMASLVEMPVDIVKIDASFTARLTAAGRGLSVMRAIVEIGRSLNLVTVAEGLATVEQADLLRGMGCDRGQGYLYAPPLAAEELVELLRPDPSVVAVD